MNRSAESGKRPSRFAMVGYSRGQTYRIGDVVRVEIAEANPLTGGLILDVLPRKS